MTEADFRAEMIYGASLTIMKEMMSERIISEDEMTAAENIIRKHYNPVISFISPCINLN